MTGKLRVIPLGGLGEFGMNMLALESGDDIVVIDAGILFPGAEQLGVDVIVPDLRYLLDNRERVRGLILTHGHEDHIGAVRYVLSQIDVPIYATAFTLALVNRRLREYGLAEKPRFTTVQGGETVGIGCFNVEFIHVTHSTVQCVSLAVETPAGYVIHTADFKIDQTPVGGGPMDLTAFAEYGKRGVLLLLSDSTNVDRRGFTSSERTVGPAFADIFTRSKEALFFTCFSSAVHRVQQIIDHSVEYGRKIALVGRSLTTASELAADLGLLRMPSGAVVRPQELGGLPRSRRTTIIAGSQGEPLSSLSRAAVGKHPNAVVEDGDAVVFSAKMIPGNERPIFRLIDHLYRRGAEVLYGDEHPGIHVSGHAAREELKLILNLVKPRYFVPVHGEYRQLSLHARMAEAVLGNALKEAFILESGDVLQFDELGARKLQEKVPVGRVFIDAGTGDEIVEELVIRDRRHLSEFGVLVPVVSINQRTGKAEDHPEILSRGFVVSEETEDLLSGAGDVIVATVNGSSDEERGDWGVMEEKVRDDLRRYLARKTSRQSRPLIVPVILES